MNKAISKLMSSLEYLKARGYSYDGYADGIFRFSRSDPSLPGPEKIALNHAQEVVDYVDQLKEANGEND